MAQDTAQRWNRTEGVLIAPGTQPEAVADRLVADRVVARLEDLRADRLIAPMAVGEECPREPNRLLYNPVLGR